MYSHTHDMYQHIELHMYMYTTFYIPLLYKYSSHICTEKDHGIFIWQKHTISPQAYVHVYTYKGGDTKCTYGTHYYLVVGVNLGNIQVTFSVLIFPCATPTRARVPLIYYALTP